MVAAAATTLTLGAGAVQAMPFEDDTDVTPVVAVRGDDGTALRHIGWGDDDDSRIRSRPRPTPLVTFEQRCVRRGLCLIRVLIDDGVRQWSCRPAVSTRVRGRDDDDAALLDGRGARLADVDRADAEWAAASAFRFGDDDDDDARAARTTRLRLACVLIRTR